ncbi:hypothetical protein [Altererythrobacter xiamenensis]|uniref:hypothetical protein n=1 Tax=Altererythrobacter xiamenensis TaxID=1316679 RepID=UPI000A396542|nr:hypothetical protein [Altererythrobacter xiamenensis]
MKDEYPLADTTAARMLSEGLARAKHEQGLSIRQIGKQMGYKTAVVLSHMALGRAPIPIDRAEELADTLAIDKTSFLQAVVRQRHPDVSWHLLTESRRSSESDNLADELETVLGCRLKDLSNEQRAVMREVAADPRPRRRWLSVHELHAVEVLREMRPSVSSNGLSAADLEVLRERLSDQDSPLK